MKLRDLDRHEYERRLKAGLLNIKTGPFWVRIKSGYEAVAVGVWSHYSDFEIDLELTYSDFHVAVTSPSLFRKYYRPQVVFYHDGHMPFYPLPAEQAFPSLEWGLNWCMSSWANHMLIIHAASLAKNDMAVVMPGVSGAGKSTLCAALALSGWRLLSDELTLIQLDGKSIVPLARPISLKNESVDVIKARFPEAVFSSVCHDTHKGSVALVKPPGDAVEKMDVPATPKWLVMPRYQKGAALSVVPARKGTMFMALAESCFNYSLLGELSFEAISTLISNTDCYDLVYSDMDEAIDWFTKQSAGGSDETRR